MSRYLLYIVIILVVILGGVYFFRRDKSAVAQDVHYHASFHILDENSTPLDLSGIEYMSISLVEMRKRHMMLKKGRYICTIVLVILFMYTDQKWNGVICSNI